MFSIEEVIQICKDLSAKYGDTFNIPVYADDLKTGALGETRIFNTVNRRIPKSITISKTLLQYGTREQVINTAKHEWIHYYLAKMQHWGHPHDAAFKTMALRIGCLDKARINVQELRTHLYKYTMHCPQCGRVLGGFNKMSKTLKNLHLYECNHCGCDKLYWQQNF